MIDYNKKSLQYIFSRVARHLLTQKKHTKNRAMMDENGLRCALGCLIPKKEYPLERSATWGIYQLIGSIGPIKHQELLTDLQDVHDKTEPHETESWPNMLKKIADKYHLKMPNI